MALVKCPDCRKDVSDAAPHCLFCGRPMASTAVQTRASPRPAAYDARSQNHLNAVCPKCGSEEFRTLPMVHASGISRSVGASVEVGRVAGHGAIGVGRSKGVSQSELSRRAAPPQRRNANWALILAVLIVLVFSTAGTAGFLVGAVLGIALVGAVGYQVHTYNTETYPPLKRVWDNSAMCERCGNVYAIG